MPYEYDLVSFKKFLYQNHPNFKPGGLSVWCKSIPIPVDIFDELFRRSDEFFSLYLEHIFGAILIHIWIKNQPGLPPFELGDLPDPEITTEYTDVLRPGFKVILSREATDDSENIFELLHVARELLGQPEFSLSPYAMLKALRHKGKKYSRIYIPGLLKKKIFDAFPEVKLILGRGNYDMFGNILADELGVYRIGFSDAFAKIFNHMLDYKTLCGSSASVKRAPPTIKGPNTSYQVNSTWLPDRTTDGALWEPFFDGQVKTRINITHPLYRHYEAAPAQQRAFQALVQKLAEYEMNAMNDKQLRHMENLRKEISRDLWLEHEMDA